MISENVWVIDLFDGIMNFIYGFLQYGVFIVLMQCGVVIQVVVYDLMCDELFIVFKGVGVFLNNCCICVMCCDKLVDCLIGIGFFYCDMEGLYDYICLFVIMMENCVGLCCFGVVVLDFVYVVCGCFDGFFEQGLSKWDMVVGLLFVMELGGLVGNYIGELGYFDQGEILVGNLKVFVQMIKIILLFLCLKVEV